MNNIQKVAVVLIVLAVLFAVLATTINLSEGTSFLRNNSFSSGSNVASAGSAEVSLVVESPEGVVP